MNKSDKYSTAHLIEDQYEPGSHDQVLRNKLGITSPDEMDRREKEEQLRAIDELTEMFANNHRFTAARISGHDHKGQRRIYTGDSDWR